MDDVDRVVLEAAHLPSARRTEVGIQLGLGVAGYHQRLNALLDDETAEREFPVLIHRLRRLRDQRRAARSRARLRTFG